MLNIFVPVIRLLLMESNVLVFFFLLQIIWYGLLTSKSPWWKKALKNTFYTCHVFEGYIQEGISLL